MDDEIVTLEAACPFCRSDLKGNGSISFFCARCNIFFGEHHLKHGLSCIRGIENEKDHAQFFI